MKYIKIYLALIRSELFEEYLKTLETKKSTNN